MEPDSPDSKAELLPPPCYSSRSSSSESLVSIDKLKDAHVDRRSSNPIFMDRRHGASANEHQPSSSHSRSRVNGVHNMARRLFRRSMPASTTPVGERVLQALKDQPAFWKADADRGTDYDMKEEELRKLTDVGNRRIGASDIWRATTDGHVGYQKTIEHLTGLRVRPRTAMQETSWWRLKGAWDRLASETNPDLFIKIVHDLDILLFGGELNGRLLVTWEDKITPQLHADMPPEKHPHPYFRHQHDHWRDPLRGWCNPASLRLLGLQKAHICLNKDLYLECEKRVLWGLIIFEMIMAYIALGCGHFANDEMMVGDEVQAVKGLCVRMLGFEGLDVRDVENGWLPVPVREEEDDGLVWT